MRLARYDEYFNDANKRLTAIDFGMKLSDKRVTEEVKTLHDHKDKLRERILQSEADVLKFKNDLIER
jgi:hypothetical protein